MNDIGPRCDAGDARPDFRPNAPSLSLGRRSHLLEVLAELRQFPVGYEACHPVHGFLWMHTSVAENFYKYTSPAGGVGALMRLLFHRTDGVEFAPTHQVRMAAAYLAPQTIGQLVALSVSGKSSPSAYRAVIAGCENMKQRRASVNEEFMQLTAVVNIAIRCFERSRDRQRRLEGLLSCLKEEKQKLRHTLGQLRKRSKNELSAPARASVATIAPPVNAPDKIDDGRMVHPQKTRLDAHRRGSVLDSLASKSPLYEALASAECRLKHAVDAHRDAMKMASLNRADFRRQVVREVAAHGLSMRPLDAVFQLATWRSKLPAKLRNLLAQRDPGSPKSFEAAQTDLANGLFGATLEHVEEPSLVAKVLTAFFWGLSPDFPALQAYAGGVAKIARQHPRPESEDIVHVDARGIVERHQSQIDEAFFPPLCNTAICRASPDSCVFPDCGESSVRNFFNVLLHQRGRFDSSRLKKSGLPIHPKLQVFYDHHFLAAEVSGQAAHNAWAGVTSDLNGENFAGQTEDIRYLSPAINPTCEIGAGGRNSLRLIKALVGTDDIERIAQSLTRGLARQPECDLTRFHPDRNTTRIWDNKIVLEFGEHIFEWCFMSRHFRCRILGPDEKRQTELKDSCLADMTATTTATTTTTTTAFSCLPSAHGATKYILGLETLDVGELLTVIYRRDLTAGHIAELVFAADLRSIDGLYRAVIRLMDAQKWMLQPFLKQCVGAMALALPKHPDHMSKRAHLVDLIRKRPVPAMYAVADELSQLDHASWVDTCTADEQRDEGIRQMQ